MYTPKPNKHSIYLKRVGGIVHHYVSHEFCRLILHNRRPHIKGFTVELLNAAG